MIYYSRIKPDDLIYVYVYFYVPNIFNSKKIHPLKNGNGSFFKERHVFRITNNGTKSYYVGNRTKISVALIRFFYAKKKKKNHKNCKSM